MAEKPINRPINQYASLEPARKRPHPDMDFQEAIKKAKREWQKDNVRPPLAATVASKSLSPTGIPGLGYLTHEGCALKSEIAEVKREEALDGTNVEQHEKRPEPERRNALGGRGNIDKYAGFSSGTGWEIESGFSTPVCPPTMATKFRC